MKAIGYYRNRSCKWRKRNIKGGWYSNTWVWRWNDSDKSIYLTGMETSCIRA